MNLLLAEIRRAFSRRLVRVLIALAIVGIVLAGVGVFLDSADLSQTKLLDPDDRRPAALVHWWVSGGDGGVLGFTGLMLLVGGLLGGASVVGAEWRSGTVITVLTWEPRRVRLLASERAAWSRLWSP